MEKTHLYLQRSWLLQSMIQQSVDLFLVKVRHSNGLGETQALGFDHPSPSFHIVRVIVCAVFLVDSKLIIIISLFS